MDVLHPYFFPRASAGWIKLQVPKFPTVSLAAPKGLEMMAIRQQFWEPENNCGTGEGFGAVMAVM